MPMAVVAERAFTSRSTLQREVGWNYTVSLARPAAPLCVAAGAGGSQSQHCAGIAGAQLAGNDAAVCAPGAGSEAGGGGVADGAG